MTSESILKFKAFINISYGGNNASFVSGSVTLTTMMDAKLDLTS